jgi:hypothetical protein
MELDDFHKEILGECADDDIGLWVIIRHASGDFLYPDVVAEPVRRKALAVIKDLLEEGLIEAGTFHKMIYNPINLSVDETIRFIEEEWDALRRSPSLGDVCWFRATPKGEQLAHDLGLEP